MKGPYRSGSRLVMDLLTAIRDEGPVGVTRLLRAANLTHPKLQDMLSSFEAKSWVARAESGDRNHWSITEKGLRVLADLQRVDAVMKDHGLEL